MAAVRNIAKFKTELMAIYHRFATFCSDHEAQIHEEILAHLKEERNLERMRRERL